LGDDLVKDSLQQIAPDLSKRLRGETEGRLRAVSVAVCRFAVESVGLHSPIVRDALERLEKGKGVPVNLRRELEKLVEDLDECYYDLDKAVEKGRAKSEDVDLAFNRARAASAVLEACREDAFVAATECVYEAWAATDQNTNAVRRLVIETLGTAKSQETGC